MTTSIAAIMKARIEAHGRALEIGLLPRVRSRTLLSSQESARIAEAGPEAIEEITARYIAETGEDPSIELDYLPRNADMLGLSI